MSAWKGATIYRGAHTPGPWTVSGCKLGNSAMVTHGNDGTFSPVIATVHDDGTRLPAEANARLIAAAPELLAALREADLELERADIYPADTKARIRAAIAKATGAA